MQKVTVRYSGRRKAVKFVTSKINIINSFIEKKFSLEDPTIVLHFPNCVGIP